MVFRRDCITLFLWTLLPSRNNGFVIPFSCDGHQLAFVTSSSSSSRPSPCLSVTVSPPTEDQYLLEDDDDDEEYDFDALLAKKEEWMQELQRLAKTSSKDPTAVTQAQSVFDEMFEAYVTTEESTMWPTVDVYNLVIETHAYSKDEHGADEAERILGRMEDKTVEFIARPNLETYQTVMDAWAMRKNPEKAQKVLERFEKRCGEAEGTAIVPLYNKLIKAYGMTGDAQAAESIFRGLLEEEEEYKKANNKSWVQTMKAYASLPDGTEKVQSLFREMLRAYRMGEEDYVPKTDAFNTLIRALGKTKGGAEETEAMLFEMIEKFRGGDEDSRPNAETFRLVIAAQSRGRNASGAKIEQLLQIQEGLYDTTKAEDLQLDAWLGNVALQAIARSRDKKKAIRAKRVIERMKNADDKLNEPSVRSYYTLLSACAYTEGTPEDNFEAFQIAVDALKELRESLDKEPDSGCFGMFLKACANLMPENRKRDGVAENVFRKCCAEGLVNDFVLAEFERASSDALQLEVLGGFLDDNVRLPSEWSRNVETR